MIANRSRRRRRHARRNPILFNPRRRKARKSRRRRSHARRNPILFNKSRRHHRMRRRRNPSAMATVKGMINKQFIIGSLLAAAGFGAGMKASSMIAKIPGVGSLGKFKGVVHILLGSLMAMYAKKPELKALAGGFAAAGAYDLLAQNAPMLKLPTLQTASVAGDEGIVVDGDWDEGTNALGVDFRGIDVQGDDGGAALVGASGSSYNSAF
jgi:hypothetical protein